MGIGPKGKIYKPHCGTLIFMTAIDIGVRCNDEETVLRLLYSSRMTFCNKLRNNRQLCMKIKFIRKD